MIEKLTLVYAYYKNRDMLKHQLAIWTHYPQRFRERVTFIIVDDGSPDGFEAAPIVKEHGVGLNVQVYKILVNIPWNQDGARNLGMMMCDTDWAFMTDMDHAVHVESMAALLNFTPFELSYYMPNQLLANGESLNRPHPNSYLMRRADFWHMGGYDEDFRGWYGTDGNFRRCAQAAGLTETHTQAFNTVVYRASDINDANTKDWGRKGSQYHVANNPELMKIRNGPPYRASKPLRFPYERQI